MVNLLHEIWTDFDSEGRPLASCCLAGPNGERLRKSLGPSARLIHAFAAGSHHEAMIVYHDFLGQGPYVSTHEWDTTEPYPIEWAALQRS